MAAGVSDFTGKIVSVVIGIVVIAAVAIPVIQGLMTDPDGEGAGVPVIDPSSTEGTVIKILPVFLVLAILMVVVRMFLNKRD